MLKKCCSTGRLTRQYYYSLANLAKSCFILKDYFEYIALTEILQWCSVFSVLLTWGSVIVTHVYIAASI